MLIYSIMFLGEFNRFDIIRVFLLDRICYQEEAITPELAIGDHKKNAEPTLLLTCDQV